MGLFFSREDPEQLRAWLNDASAKRVAAERERDGVKMELERARAEIAARLIDLTEQKKAGAQALAEAEERVTLAVKESERWRTAHSALNVESEGALKRLEDKALQMVAAAARAQASAEVQVHAHMEAAEAAKVASARALEAQRQAESRLKAAGVTCSHRWVQSVYIRPIVNGKRKLIRVGRVCNHCRFAPEWRLTRPGSPESGGRSAALEGPHGEAGRTTHDEAEGGVRESDRSPLEDPDGQDQSHDREDEREPGVSIEDS